MEWISAPIHVVADREFASPKLAEWLKETYGIDSTLRLKASMYLRGDGTPETKIAELVKRMAKHEAHRDDADPAVLRVCPLRIRGRKEKSKNHS